MATGHANKILTKFMLLLGGHNHCVKVSSDSETVRGMGLWEFSGALRELMLICKPFKILLLFLISFNLLNKLTVHVSTFLNVLSSFHLD